MAEKVLVTGGAGFIGSHLIDDLLNIGFDVVCLDDLSGGYRSNVSDRAKFVLGSVVDAELVNRLFQEFRFDYVFHLAAYAAEGLSHFIRRFNYTVNLIGSVNMINASVLHKVRCFVFTSSIAVYGDSQPPMSEDVWPNPQDPYGISKFAVEMDLRAAHEMFGLNWIVFRPHNVYGERQNISDRYRNVVGIFMNQILKGEPMTIFGDGDQMRAFSYVGDVVSVIARSVYTPVAYNQVFNIGTDVPCTINYLALCVAKAMGVIPEVKYLPARNEVRNAYSLHDKADKTFGVEFPLSLPDGLARMAEWVHREGACGTSSFKNIEIREGLPLAWQEIRG